MSKEEIRAFFLRLPPMPKAILKIWTEGGEKGHLVPTRAGPSISKNDWGTSAHARNQMKVKKTSAGGIHLPQGAGLWFATGELETTGKS